jgi:uncharacterized protein YbbC (DUF1343 family)
VLWAARLGGEAFRWRTEEYEYRDDVPAIDLLTGSDAFRLGVDGGLSLEAITAPWEAELQAFLPTRRRHLLYPET